MIHEELIESSQLEELLARAVKQSGIPGIAVALLQQGSIITACAGRAVTSNPIPMDPHTRFETGCLNQMLVSLVALNLAAEGELDLESPISRYLPELSADKKGNQILIWHLLSHSSGYKGIGDESEHTTGQFCWSDFITYFSKTPQVFSPGNTFNYHLADHVVLGEILRRLTGMDAQALIRTLILARSGQASTVKPLLGAVDAEGHEWNVNTKSFEIARDVECGALWSPSVRGCPLSLVEMACVMSRAFETDDEISKFLQRQVVRVPLAPIALYELNNWRILMSFGLGSGAFTDGSVGVNGSTIGQCCAIYYHSLRRIGVAIGINARAIRLRNRIAAILLSRLRRNSSIDQLVRKNTVSFSAEELVGIYTGGIDGDHLCVSRHDKRIVVRRENGGLSRPIESQFSVGVDEIVDPNTQSYGEHSFFFRENKTGHICVMQGMRAYKRQLFAK